MKLLKVKAALKKTFISLFCLAPQVKTREVKVRNRRKIKQRVKSFPLRARDQGWLIRRLTDRSHSLGSLKILKNKVPQAPKVFFFFNAFFNFCWWRDPGGGEESQSLAVRRGEPQRDEELVYISWAAKWRSWMPLVWAAMELLSFRRRTRYIS